MGGGTSYKLAPAGSGGSGGSGENSGSGGSGGSGGLQACASGEGRLQNAPT